MYAIIEDSGTQIKVTPGDVIDIDLREVPANGGLIFSKVLAIGTADGTPARIGAPYIAGASVTAEFVTTGDDGDKDNETAEVSVKTVSNNYSRRKGWRRKRGQKQRYLRVKIASIAG